MSDTISVEVRQQGKAPAEYSVPKGPDGLTDLGHVLNHISQEHGSKFEGLTPLVEGVKATELTEVPEGAVITLVTPVEGGR